MATPIWQADRKRWRLLEQYDGQRKAFYSKKTGRAGMIEVKQKAANWKMSGLEEMRLKAALEKYLDDVQARSGTENYLQRKNYADHYLSKLNHMVVSDISDQQWQDIINLASRKGYKGKPLSAKSLCNLKATIIDFAHWSKRSRLIATMPDLSMPRKIVAKKPKRILAKDDLAKLFQPSDEWYINAWRLMVVTGMRPGECYGLTYDDVDGDVISVNRSINRLNEMTAGKTANATRRIPVCSVSRTVINNQIALARKGVWLFAERDGSPARPNIAYKHWRAYRNAHELTATLYELRHTFVSIMKTKLNEAALKSIVGHSKNMNTLKTYGHEVDGEMQEISRAMDTAWVSLVDTLKEYICTNNKTQKPGNA